MIMMIICITINVINKLLEEELTLLSTDEYHYLASWTFLECSAHIDLHQEFQPKTKQIWFTLIYIHVYMTHILNKQKTGSLENTHA